MGSSLDLKLFQPDGQLSDYVQAVWSASVSISTSDTITKWLVSDGCSGVVFNFKGEIAFGDSRFAPGIILLPVSKQAVKLVLPAGAQLAGLRFQPAIGFAVMGMHFDEPTALLCSDDKLLHLHHMFSQLIKKQWHYACIVELYRWLDSSIDFSVMLPVSLAQAIKSIPVNKPAENLSDNIMLSQRQLERQFQKWMGITPKHFQRIIRVKNALHALKNNPATGLVDLALSYGFTDQAHMTREFKQIARITPGKLSKLLSCGQS